MRCPRCDAALEAYEPQRRVTAHACPAGEGALLLASELQRALPVAAHAALVDAPAVGPGPACPACAAPMLERALERHGDEIHLDTCTSCAATWFDAGELSRTQAPPPSSPSGAGPGGGARSLHGARHFAGENAIPAAMVVADPGVWHAIAGFIAMLFDN